MSEYTIKNHSITAKMKEEVRKTTEWIRDDYAEHNDRIGKIKVEYEFEEYQAMKCEVLEDGKKRYTHDPNGEITYELVVTIMVPLLGMTFDATDHHQYRWNEKNQQLDHESTDIY